VSPWAGSSWNGRHQAKRRIESSELGSLFDCVSVPFSRWALDGQTLTKAECTCRSGTLQPKSLMQRKKMVSEVPPLDTVPRQRGDQRQARSVQYSRVRRLLQNDASSFQILASVSTETAGTAADPVNRRANSDDRDGRGSMASSSIVGDAVQCGRATLHRQPMTAPLMTRERSMTCAVSRAVLPARVQIRARRRFAWRQCLARC